MRYFAIVAFHVIASDFCEAISTKQESASSGVALLATTYKLYIIFDWGLYEGMNVRSIARSMTVLLADEMIVKHLGSLHVVFELCPRGNDFLIHLC